LPRTTEREPTVQEADAIVEAVEQGTDQIALARDMQTEAEIEHDPPLPVKIQGLAVPQRIKLALTGNRGARAVLIRDQNKLIRHYVLRNPRLTEDEVLIMAKDKNIDEESLRFITVRREWMKAYQIRLAIAQNPRAPIPQAIHLLSTLFKRDLERIAKSRDVTQAVVVHARKLVIQARERGQSR